MPDMTLLAVVAGIAAVAVAVLVGQRMWLRSRARAWAQVAGRLGLAPAPTPELLPGASGFRTFQQGHSQRLLPGAAGASWGGDALLADQQWVTGHGRNRKVHRQTVCVLRHAGLALPHFVLRPERAVLDRLGALFGAQDFDFSDDPEFSREFVLAGEDEAAVRALFSPSLRMQLRHLGEPHLHLEGSGPVLVVHHGRLVPPAEAGGLLEQAVQVAGLLRG